MTARHPNKLISSLQISNFEYCPTTGIITNTKTNYKYTRVRKDGYIQIDVPGRKQVLAHRLAWYLYYGSEPDHIDHANGIRYDNRIANLRSVTSRENQVNKKKYSTTTMTGATLAKSLNPIWRSQVNSARVHKRTHLGYYKSQYDAHLVRTLYMAINYPNYQGRDLDTHIGGVPYPYFDGSLQQYVNSITCNSGHNPMVYMTR